MALVACLSPPRGDWLRPKAELGTKPKYTTILFALCKRKVRFRSQRDSGPILPSQPAKAPELCHIALHASIGCAKPGRQSVGRWHSSAQTATRRGRYHIMWMRQVTWFQTYRGLNDFLQLRDPSPAILTH